MLTFGVEDTPLGVQHVEVRRQAFHVQLTREAFGLVGGAGSFVGWLQWMKRKKRKVKMIFGKFLLFICHCRHIIFTISESSALRYKISVIQQKFHSVTELFLKITKRLT